MRRKSLRPSRPGPRAMSRPLLLPGVWIASTCSLTYASGISRRPTIALIAREREMPGTGVEILRRIPSWLAIGHRQDRWGRNPQTWRPVVLWANDGNEARTGVQRGSGARD